VALLTQGPLLSLVIQRNLISAMSVEMSATLLHWNGTSKPVTYMSTDLIPPGELRSFATVEVTVPIEDARSLQQQPTLDSAGYELLEAATPLSTAQFYDADIVTTRYYDECCELLKGFTGADKVVAFDHNVRVADVDLFADRSQREPATSGAIEPDGPVHFVHNDYTDVSGPQRVRDLCEVGGSYTVAGKPLLSAREAEAMLAGKHRFAFVNVWRPINHPVTDVPLAVCDARSMRDDDFSACDLVYPDRTGQTHIIQHKPRHRWMFYSEQRKDEALLLKCWDSERDGEDQARYTAHTVSPEDRGISSCVA
jgi:hypothetical protein